MKVYLSPKRLSLFLECRYCFFEEVFERFKRPRGAYPTLPTGIDEVLKSYCDQHRAEGTIPEQLKKFVGGHVLLENQKAIDDFRFWKKGLSATFDAEVEYSGVVRRHEYFVNGAVDELLFDPDTDTFAIPDFKTRKDEPEPEYSKKYYQITMDTYAWLLEQMGFEPNNRAFLWYLWPESIESINEKSVSIKFGSTVQELETNPERITKILNEIVEMTPKDSLLPKNLEEKRPKPNPECEYCNYRRLK